jgi:hypothetical protein
LTSRLAGVSGKRSHACLDTYNVPLPAVEPGKSSPSVSQIPRLAHNTTTGITNSRSSQTHSPKPHLSPNPGQAAFAGAVSTSYTSHRSKALQHQQQPAISSWADGRHEHRKPRQELNKLIVPPTHPQGLTPRALLPLHCAFPAIQLYKYRTQRSLRDQYRRCSRLANLQPRSARTVQSTIASGSASHEL